MKKSRTSIAIIVFSILAFSSVSLTTRAQDKLNAGKMKSYFYFQPNFGVSQYFGDLNLNANFNRDPQFAFGCNLGWQLSPAFGLRGQFMKTNLYSKREDQNKVLNSDLWDGALQLVINVNEIFSKYNEKRVFNFYLFSGAGFTFYNSTLEYIKPSEVINRHTETQKELFVPLGAGASFRLSHNLSLNLEYGDHMTFRSDALDFTAFGKKNDHYSYASIGIQVKYDAKDSDGDGVKDINDVCPDVAGKIELAGCPDTDNDGIPDRDDACPDVAGIILFKGCPDSDGDSIPDNEDACPFVAGKPELKGCPDKDGDGIADKDDRCPDVAGKIEFMGCLDRDGDGVSDIDDACPDEKGPIYCGGCPDADGDSIPDKDDACPDIFGKVKLKGCPDKDGDGVADKDDKCPDIRGEIFAFGCPDRDGDSIPDNADACPDVKGLAKYAGCPDTDGDGIPDNLDKCPTVAGVAANKGCPVITKGTLLRKTIYFNMHETYPAEKNIIYLNEIAAFMNMNPGTTISVSGYADDNGTEQYNFRLSLERADNVINYLQNWGMKTSKIRKYFYGADKPATGKTTAEGRALNRRVEIKIER